MSLSSLGGSKGRRSGQMMNMFKKPFTTLNRGAAAGGGSRALGSQHSLGGSKPDFVQELSNEMTAGAGGSESNLSAVGNSAGGGGGGNGAQGGGDNGTPNAGRRGESQGNLS